MRISLTSLLIVTFCMTSYGQYTFGVKFNGGFSKISNSFVPSNALVGVYYTPSFQGGCYYNLDLRENSILVTELLLVQMNGKEIYELNLTGSNGNSAGHSTVNLMRKISYLSLPVYYGFKLNKLVFNVGIQSSIAITNRAIERTQVVLDGQIENYENMGRMQNIDSYDLGPRIGFSYQITDKFMVESVYYYGINNILHRSLPNWTWRTQQATIGLRYVLKSGSKGV